MSVPEQYLVPALWRSLVIDSLYTVEPDGSIHPEDPRRSTTVYRSARVIPKLVIHRISESTKRLENGLEASVVQEGPWGKVFMVTGSGSNIGVVVAIEPDAFGSCHRTPDGVHLVRGFEEFTDLPIIKPLFSYKTFRSFRIGPPGEEDAPHDLELTAKKRWFRRKNNPKFLGFSKDDKV